MKAKIFTGVPESGKTRVARMIAEHVGKEKTHWIDAKELTRKKLNFTSYLFNGISDNVQLVVFDDCPIDFDYSLFMSVENNNDNIKFRLWVNERGKVPRVISVPQIIFTTEKLHPMWFEVGASFNVRFDIVQFPLSKVD